ncbi:hypothetical protein Plhal304r1_c001g0001621 [Plasmopara halstedii]
MSVESVDTQRIIKFETGLKDDRLVELFRAALSNDRTARNFQVLLQSSFLIKLLQILASHWYRNQFAFQIIDTSN